MGEITFGADKKHRDKYMTGISYSHPAKMSLPLQRWIIEHFTKPGDVVLDPMSGSGTILIACTMGRNVVCVELESKFVDIIKGNWQKIQTLGAEMGYQMGTATILQGDARNLPGLLADSIITSPPYADKVAAQDLEFYKEKLRQTGRNPESDHAKGISAYSDNPTNIGNLRYGNISAIVTSPPYENGASGPSRSPFWDRLANDPTSARYGRQKHPSLGEGYHQVDSILTSPPYEGSLQGEKTEGDRQHRIDIGRNPDSPGSYNLVGYSESPTNIGNLKSASYMEAMFAVYQQCHAVLKPGGLLCLVVKNFIRDQKEIRLDSDTIALCEKAGFTFVERHYRKLTAQSFWRTIYAKKYPLAPVLDKEDILIFRKSE